MGNRYDEERGWGRRGSSPRYSGSQGNFDRSNDDDDYDQPGERYYGGERYFGSGRQGFGEGYTESYGDPGSSRGFREDRFGGGSSGGGRRREGGRSSRNYGDQYRGGSNYGDQYRGSSGQRSGSSYRGQSGSEYGGRYTGGSGNSPYGQRASRYGSGRGGVYGGSYPESERGFMTDRESYEGEERGWWDRTSDEIASWFGDEEAERRREMDERQSYRGRGPRGYTRSDDRIKEDINDELTDAWNLDASDIEVEVNDGNVVLSGTVTNRNAKRNAEDIAEDVSGVKNVENRIRVSNQTYSQGTMSTGTSMTGSSSSGLTTSTSDTSKSTTAGQS